MRQKATDPRSIHDSGVAELEKTGVPSNLGGIPVLFLESKVLKIFFQGWVIDGDHWKSFYYKELGRGSLKA